MNKFALHWTLLWALLYFSLSSPSMAGVVMVDDPNKNKNEKQDKSANERDATNSYDNNGSPQSKPAKEDQASQKKPQKNNLIFGF